MFMKIPERLTRISMTSIAKVCSSNYCYSPMTSVIYIVMNNN